MHEQPQELPGNPLKMSTQDVFDNQMSQNSVLASLQAPITDDRGKDMLALIMRSLLVGAEELLNRQLEDSSPIHLQKSSHKENLRHHTTFLQNRLLVW